MHEAVGKNGIGPPQLAPARIYRPGDAGFPTDQPAAPQEAPVIRPQISAKTRQCVNCKQEFIRTSNRQQRCPGCAMKSKPGKAVDKPATVSSVARAITALRTKEVAAKVEPSAFDTQVGGDHYKTMAIQPLEFIARNNLGFCAGNVVKYVCRHQLKGGREDLDKAIHYLELLRETMYGKGAA